LAFGFTLPWKVNVATPFWTTRSEIADVVALGGAVETGSVGALLKASWFPAELVAKTCTCMVLPSSRLVSW
jgi:hypothetical protein